MTTLMKLQTGPSLQARAGRCQNRVLTSTKELAFTPFAAESP